MLKRVLLGLVPVVLLVLGGGAGVLLYLPESEANPELSSEHNTTPHLQSGVEVSTSSKALDGVINVDRLDCMPSPIIDFVQITISQLDAGEQTFEAFRILRNGRVEWARWNSSGLLLNYMESVEVGRDTFDRIVSSNIFQNSSYQSQNEDVLGHPAYRLEITTLTQSGIGAVFMHEMPNDLATLVQDIKHRAVAAPVQPGWYVWTQPYPLDGNADVDLSEPRCNSVVAKALSEAVTTGRLIVLAEDSIRDYISGQRKSRTTFVARLAEGDLRFGVLTTRK